MTKCLKMAHQGLDYYFLDQVKRAGGSEAAKMGGYLRLEGSQATEIEH